MRSRVLTNVCPHAIQDVLDLVHGDSLGRLANAHNMAEPPTRLYAIRHLQEVYHPMRMYGQQLPTHKWNRDVVIRTIEFIGMVEEWTHDVVPRILRANIGSGDLLDLECPICVTGENLLLLGS
jgi:hypothetical protein